MSIKAANDNQQEASVGHSTFDDAAFELLFRQLYAKLCVYCKFRFGFDIDIAEDVVNTGFVKLWEARKGLAADLSPKSYLYRIINNLSLNILKHERIKQKHIRYLLKTTTEKGGAEDFERIDLKQLRVDIEAAIAELPEQMRRIFELSRVQGLKYLQISTQLNISVKTVETQMGRALSKLRTKLSVYLSLFVF